MVADPFFASVLTWHDFYTAVAAATAALLGLLFVAVSIRLSNSTKARRLHERALAVNVFSDLVAALVLALVMLIPDQDARSVGAQLGLVTVLTAVRVVRRAIALWRNRARAPVRRDVLRRLGWTAFAVANLAYAVAGLWIEGAPGYLYALLAAVFIFLIGAADASWGLLLPAEEAAG